MKRSNIYNEEDGKGGIRISKKTRTLTVLGSTLGVLMIVVGISCAIFRLPQRFVDHEFRSVLTLSPDSEIYQDWIKPPVPIYMKFHIFNVTNSEAIALGEKPKLQECGPYTFRLKAPKTNVTFHPNNTVSYFNKYTLLFEPRMSKGMLNDSLILLNVPLTSMASTMKALGASPVAFSFMNDLVKQSDGGDALFTEKTPHEILFGYRDPIFMLLNSMSIVDRVNFGFFMEFNQSNDGEFLVHTGADHSEQTFQISKWKGNSSLNFWTSKYANMINGTDGTFLGTNLQKEDTPYVYVPDMCRSIKLEYGGISWVKGIETFRFRTATDMFSNHSINPDNAGFCTPTGNCFDSGVLNIARCTENAPVFVSLPHFYNAAETYQNSVVGLHPEKSKHESYYFAEPKTGAVLKSYRRLQINLHLQPSTMLDKLERVPDTIFPMLWVEGSAEANNDTAGKIKTALSISKVAWVTSYIVLCFGVLTLMISVNYCARKRLTVVVWKIFVQRKAKNKKIIEVEKSKSVTKECTSALL